ncbi:MAG: IclR family transcriptional regulator [Microbacterium sp.]
MSKATDVEEEAVGRPVGARTLVRGFTVLELVADSPQGIGVTEIAQLAELDKGTVSRLLSTLRQMGYVQQRTVDRRFVLGSRCLWLARAYRSRQEEITDIAAPLLAELRDATQETVHLAIREGFFVAFVAQEQPDRSIRVRSAIGSRLPLHRTAMGRALLALLGDEERQSLIAAIVADAEERGETVDVDGLLADVEAGAERGWALVDRHDDVTRIASAIIDPDGEPIAAITLSGPTYRVDPELDRFGEAVAGTARAVSAAMRH